MKNLTKALILVLCLVLVVASAVACDKDPAKTTGPDTTVETPEDTTPEVTTPEETEPEVTTPEETEPQETEPEETLPQETLPQETTPAETEPEETKPAETTPAETTPAETTKPADPSTPHTHKYTMIEYPPTCTMAGRKLYSCSCGSTYEEAGLAATGHGFAQTLYEPAYCYKTGRDIKTCVTCGLVQDKVLPKLPHNFSVSSLVVSAADLAEGTPFEILACTGCKEMKLVEANHASGHYLDANGVCACGAVALALPDTAIDDTNVIYDDCEHAFASEALVDDTHPEAEGWLRFTCSECERFFDRVACAEDTHAYAKEPISVEGGNCLEEGIGTHECLFCEETKEFPYPAGHNYSVFVEVVSAEDDRLGKGCERWACVTCGETIRIDGNDESGHKFDDKGECACGAKLSDRIPLLVEDFEDDEYTMTVGRTDLIANGVWKISGTDQQQCTFTKGSSEIFTKLYEGTYADDIDKFILAFDFFYTGDASVIKGGYWNWRAYNRAFPGDSSYKDQFTPSFGKNGTQLTFKAGNSEVHTLTANKHYIISFEIEPTTKTVSVYLDDTLLHSFVCAEYEKFETFFLSRSQLYCGDDTFTMNIDGITLALHGKYIDESKMAENDCEHAFVAEPVVDEEHPEDGDWYKMTCAGCSAFYYEQGCSVYDHIWGEEPTETTVTCKGGTETYECKICGETEDRTADAIDHAYTRFVSVTPAEGETAGYETRMCTWCEETETYEGNHVSGHNFDEDGACACGETATKMTQVVGSLDFDDYELKDTTMVGDGFAIRGGSASVVDGAWRISTVGANGYVESTSYNAPLYDLLDGVYQDNTAVFDEIVFAFDTYYTDTVPTSVSGSVFSWRDESLGYPASCLVEVNLGNKDGKLTISGKNGSATLTAGDTYRVTITMNVKTNAVSIVLTGENIDPVSLANFTASGNIGELEKIYLTRKEHAIDTTVGAIFWDNITVAYNAWVID